MSEKGEIYTAGKYFTLLPAVTAVTNSTSAGNITMTNDTQPFTEGMYLQSN